jgi:hypothetical protein
MTHLPDCVCLSQIGKQAGIEKIYADFFYNLKNVVIASEWFL